MATERQMELFASAASTSAVPPLAVEPAATGRDDILVEMVKLKLSQQGDEDGSSSMAIFRVPAHVRDANKELYEPRLVSIGPYYRGREALRTMEQHKWRYLRELLDAHPKVSLADCARAVRKKEVQARRCYSDKHVNCNNAGSGGNDIHDGQQSRPTDFAEMLLLDGCFILQFFRKLHRNEADKLYDVGWGLGLLHSDLLLLENQIPFFVLEDLFELFFVPEAEKFHIFSLILPRLGLGDSTFFSQQQLTDEQVADRRPIDHLLHLFHVAFVPTVEHMVSAQDSQPRLFLQFVAQVREQCIRLKKNAVAVFRNSILADNNGAQPAPPPLVVVVVVPSVTMLREAGVRFKEKKSPRHMFDLTFDKGKGVMEIPRIEVEQASKPLLVNLIAFEQTTVDLRLLSSYTALMGFLVKTGKDVEQLQKWGIMDNLLSSDDDAATSFFHHLGDCCCLDYSEHHFTEIFTDLDQYHKAGWNKHKAKFLREYCSSPWAIIAGTAAALLFLFGVFKLAVTINGLVHHGR
ncbi:unnamed protein product [Urochloa decumbens]|uniref:Uncharacterized protein n=1 Tax=Urochloa decumbens TaxID=240449 RepID=A0ABC9GQ29_9POAL